MSTFDAKRICDAVYAQSNPDKSKTLQGWQKRAQVVRAAVLELKKEHQEAAKPFYEKYLPRVADKMAKDLWGDTDAVIAERVDKLRADLKEVIDGKRTQFEKIGLSAPSEEQLRLLQTAALRDDLTEGEVSRMGAAMAGNFQAMRALRSIAAKSGIRMVAPPSLESFEESLTNAENFCNEMLRLVDKPDGELNYNSKCFYEHIDTGKPKFLFNQLDNCLHSAVQMEGPANE